MPCRGCSNLQCNCFTSNSDSVDAFGNGSQYAPFTFRPNNIPTPRPFGATYGTADQASMDGTVYTNFSNAPPFLNQGGDMIAGNGTHLTARADGIYLVGMQASFAAVATDNLNDSFSLRKNGVQVTSITFANTSTVSGGLITIMTSTTLLDMNTGDTLDLFAERIAGAGTITMEYFDLGGTIVAPRIWAVWMGGPI